MGHDALRDPRSMPIPAILEDSAVTPMIDPPAEGSFWDPADRPGFEDRISTGLLTPWSTDVRSMSVVHTVDTLSP